VEPAGPAEGPVERPAGPAGPGERPAERYNATVDLLERNLAAGRGDRPYLLAGARTWSYQEVCAAADGAGAGLLDLGLGPGSRVLLMTRDRPELVAGFWGAIKAGLVPVPLAGGLSPSDLRFVLDDSGAGVLVCDASSARTASPAVQGTGAALVFVGEDPPEGALPWAKTCGRPRRLDAAPTTPQDPALWLYTSGTTGEPKAAVHRQRSLRAAPAGLASQVLGMGAEDVVLSVSKMFFAYGLGNSVYLPAAAGASVVVSGGPVVPAGVQAALEAARPTLLFGVPAFFAGFAELPDAALPPSVRAVVSAGETLGPALLERFRTRFGLPPLDGLGATEALHHVTSNRPDDVVPASAGRPLDGFEVRVVDAEDQEVEEGRTGRLWVRGPTLFDGYWHRPELTRRAYDGRWLRTGDLARVVDGRVFHEGRVDDLLKVGGMWVSPREIEDVIRSHPDVRDVGVALLDEGDGVPVLKAFLRSDRDDRDLRRELANLCGQRLASFKVPKVFEVVAELPRTATGKLQRFRLGERR
jgi:benzoate-CoA ligase family protein